MTTATVTTPATATTSLPSSSAAAPNAPSSVPLSLNGLSRGSGTNLGLPADVDSAIMHKFTPFVAPPAADPGAAVEESAAKRKMNMSPSQSELLRLRRSSFGGESDFNFENYAKRFFQPHKVGLFRRKQPIAQQMSWTPDVISETMTAIPFNTKHKTAARDALNIFRLTQMVMGDRELRRFPTTSHIIQFILEKALLMPEIRDEIYAQLCKQVSNNPSQTSLEQGWILMSILVWMFPPSRSMENYLKHFVLAHYADSNPKIDTLSRYSFKKLLRVCETGARARVPTLPEIERARDAPFHPSVFGSTLDDIMSMQVEKFPDATLPLVLTSLTQAVIQHNGARTEGIFRVPGDTDAVFSLKLKIEKSDYSFTCDDPHVPASLLKLWLRELDEPVITTEFYPECVRCAKDAKEACAIVERLPPINRDVVKFLIKFLRNIGDPANQGITKMTLDNLAMVFAPSFLRCPSENPQTIFENTRYEQDFTKTLLEHLN